jgi:hypothetical protein
MATSGIPGTGLTDTLAEWAKRAEADVSILYDPVRGEWAVMANFGREAPDSPMAAGSALGADDSLTKAIEQALRDVRINPCAECGWEQECEEGCHT